jgi:hypothetical protein
MKAAVIHSYGGPEVGSYEDYPDPRPAPGEALVRAAAAGVNPVCLRQREGGAKDWCPVIFPGVHGWDLSEAIVALGEGVRDMAIGEKAFAWGYHSYAPVTEAKSPPDFTFASRLVGVRPCKQLVTKSTGSTARTATGSSSATTRCAPSRDAASTSLARTQAVTKQARSLAVNTAQRPTAPLAAETSTVWPTRASPATEMSWHPVALTSGSAAASTRSSPARTFASSSVLTTHSSAADAYPLVRTQAFVSKKDARSTRKTRLPWI